jgi:hypothetical protein
MALDPSIPGAVTLPRINSPAENTTIALQQRSAQAKLDAEERTLREQQAAQQVLAEAGGDYRKALPKLRQVAPALALGVEKQLLEQRKTLVGLAKDELDIEKAQRERTLSMLRRADATNWATLRPLVLRDAPEDVAAMLPEQFDPSVVGRLQQSALTAEQYEARQRRALEWAVEGKWRKSIGAALSLTADQAEWDEVLAAQRALGAPDEELALFGMRHSPAAAQRAGLQAMTPAERSTREDRIADNERAASNDAATQSYRDAQLGVSRGQLAVAQGNLLVRQSEAAAGGGEGGDTAGLVEAVMANPAIYSTLTPTARTKIAPALAQRGFKGFQDGSGGGKPSTGAQKRVFNFFNRAKQADEELQALEPQIAQMGLAGQTRMEWMPNMLQSQTGQSYLAAQRAFTEARLRKDSGAAIPDSEFDNDRRTYFAQPGDSPATLAQKARARAAVLSSLAFESGPALSEFYGPEAVDLAAEYRARASKDGAQNAGAKPAPAGGAAPKPTLRFNPKTGAFEKVGG